MIQQLNHFFEQTGFRVLPSNTTAIAGCFRIEPNYVNVIQLIDFEQTQLFLKAQYEELKVHTRDIFIKQGFSETHILSIVITEEPDKAKLFCEGDSFCWIIGKKDLQLYLFENQIADFYGLKSKIEYFLTQPQLLQEEIEVPEEDIKKKTDFKKLLWVNIALVSVNVLVAIVTFYTGDLLYKMGSCSALDVLQNNDYYRIVTSMFLHADAEHLLSNMMILYFVGEWVENELGKGRYFLVYMISGICGNLLSMGFEMLTRNFVSSIGASGAVFGVIGGLLYLVLGHKGRAAKLSPGRMIFMVAYSIYSGFMATNINNTAHIGGVITGFVITWLLCFRRTVHED